MSVSDIICLISAFVLMAFAAICAAQDTAMAVVSPARVADMKKRGEPGARNMLAVVDNRGTYLSLVVFLRIVLEITSTILFATVFLSTVGTMTGPGTGTTWALTYAGIVSVLLSYVIVGVTGRSFARYHPYGVLRRTALPLMVLGVVLGPLSSLLVKVGSVITPGKGKDSGTVSSDIELREFVTLAQQSGGVEDDMREMIESVFDLGEHSARSAMVPRTDMVWIEKDKSAGQAVKLAVKSGFSRIPVVGETIDDIVGIVYLKDLVASTYTATDGGQSVPVKDVMRPVWLMPDSKNLDDLLDEMKHRHNHIAILIDEYGGVAGLITIEDILEEIVGEITDEYDAQEVAPIEPLADDTWRVSARLTLEDLAELTDVEFGEDVEEEVDTVGGLLSFALGRVPLPGAHIAINGLDLVAEAGQDRRGRRRVTTVLVRRDTTSEPTSPSSPKEESHD